MNTVWIAFKSAAWNVLKTDLKNYRANPEANTVAPKSIIKFLDSGLDQGTINLLFKPASIGGSTYYMIDVLTTDNVLDKINEIDVQYGNQVTVVRSWDAETGLRLGTSRDAEGNIVGTPIHDTVTPAQILKFMPDVDGLAATQTIELHQYQGHPARVLF